MGFPPILVLSSLTSLEVIIRCDSYALWVKVLEGGKGKGLQGSQFCIEEVTLASAAEHLVTSMFEEGLLPD
ncbi:hypothetical protein VNO77_37312 [Canavalia gladiata]|uniref:Uncharacterized protein n=1 Tax=Canavalia gladiata TaxID=3824 RepID=A0AAN9KBC3_CANGL